MTRGDVPFDVLLDEGPPESVEEGATCGVETFVTELVMSVLDETESLGRGNVELVAPVVLLSPKTTVEQKVVCGHPKESGGSLVVQVGREL
jgi:hypothetical protein